MLLKLASSTTNQIIIVSYLTIYSQITITNLCKLTASTKNKDVKEVMEIIIDSSTIEKKTLKLPSRAKVISKVK